MSNHDELLARLDMLAESYGHVQELSVYEKSAAAIRDLTDKLEAWQELSDHVTISPTGIYPGRYTDPAVQRVAQWIKDTEAKLEAERKRHTYYAAAFGATCEKHSHDEIPSACVFCALEAERRAREDVEADLRGMTRSRDFEEQRAARVSEILQRWVNFRTKSDMTAEIIKDDEKFRAHMAAIESAEELLVKDSIRALEPDAQVQK